MELTEEQREQIDPFIRELRKENANLIVEAGTRIADDDFNSITLRDEINLLKEKVANLEFVSLYRETNG